MTTATDRLLAALAEEYDLQGEIGSGGMGTLYLARERRLDRLVVIKTPRLDLLSERLAARFLREARLLARPGAHPNLVQVYHCREAAGRVPAAGPDPPAVAWCGRHRGSAPCAGRLPCPAMRLRLRCP